MWSTSIAVRCASPPTSAGSTCRSWARLRPSVTPRIELGLENESNLGAVAELRAGGRSGTANLVYVLAERGVGGGIVVNGNLLRAHAALRARSAT